MLAQAYIADATAQGTEQDEFTETAFTEVSKNFQMCINDKMEVRVRGCPLPLPSRRGAQHVHSSAAHKRCVTLDVRTRHTLAGRPAR